MDDCLTDERLRQETLCHWHWVSHVFLATSLEGSIHLVTDEDPGIRNASFTCSSVRLRDMDHTRCRWTTTGSRLSTWSANAKLPRSVGKISSGTPRSQHAPV